MQSVAFNRNVKYDGHGERIFGSGRLSQDDTYQVCLQLSTWGYKPYSLF
jgi:hypothetical protein